MTGAKTPAQDKLFPEERAEGWDLSLSYKMGTRSPSWSRNPRTAAEAAALFPSEPFDPFSSQCLSGPAALSAPASQGRAQPGLPATPAAPRPRYL